MKNKLISEDYKDELASIAEKKGFSQDAENLLLSMVYKLEDCYKNYRTVKREVPEYDEFIREIINNVKVNCQSILIAEPRTMLEAELKKNQVSILTEEDLKTQAKRVISYPNEKTLLYGIEKVSIPPLKSDYTIEEKALITTINIGRCISKAESIRDFNGWSWSISKNEIESTECNVIYNFLCILLGYRELENIDMHRLKEIIPQKLYTQILKVSLQFYMSYDKSENENILKKITENKVKMEKMKNHTLFVQEVIEMKKRRLLEISKIDEILNSANLLKTQYIQYSSKITRVGSAITINQYAQKLQNRKIQIMKQIEEFNKFIDPNTFIIEKAKIGAQIRLYEDKTNIDELEKEFIKCLKTKLAYINNKNDIINLIYQVRYLNYFPNLKIDLTEIEEKIIPKAISLNAITPISGNNLIDYRVLKGIFKSKAISLENLYIKLSPSNIGLRCEIYDGDMLENSYDAKLPEEAQVQIVKIKKNKIFE